MQESRRRQAHRRHVRQGLMPRSANSHRLSVVWWQQEKASISFHCTSIYDHTVFEAGPRPTRSGSGFKMFELPGLQSSRTEADTREAYPGVPPPCLCDRHKEVAGLFLARLSSPAWTAVFHGCKDPGWTSRLTGDP